MDYRFQEIEKKWQKNGMTKIPLLQKKTTQCPNFMDWLNSPLLRDTACTLATPEAIRH